MPHLRQPATLALEQNAPNPFNPTTAIRFSIPEIGRVYLAVYDVNGRLVRVLIDGELSVGAHEVTWDGRDEVGHEVASGVYLARLQYRASGSSPTNGHAAAVRRMVLVR